jgi:ABC-type multidrug transport system fused ATPase/permease subunit
VRHWSFLRVYLAPQWRKASVLAVFLFAAIALQIIGPLILRHFIDAATRGVAVCSLGSIALSYIFVAFVARVVSIAEAYAADDVAWTATNCLRTDLVLRCLRLDLAFHQAHTPGELIERIDGDVGTLANLFSRFLVAVLGNALLLAGILLVLIGIDHRVGLVVASYAVLRFVVLRRLGRSAQPHFTLARQAIADLYGFLEERLGGTEDIRALGAVDHMLGRLTPVLQRRVVTSRRVVFLHALLWSASVLLSTMGMALAFGLAAYLYAHGAVTIGTSYLIFDYTMRLAGPVGEISDQVADAQQAAASLARIQALLDARPTIQDGPGSPLPSAASSVAFEHVTFGYRAGEAVLHDISFTLTAGKVLGVVGRTGSGKTTLARLLVRFYDPDQGAVRLGGIDLLDARVDEVRTRVALITQEVQLFHATVRDNVTLFDDHLGDDTILAALENLGLRAWCQGLPRGLDTVLAAGGSGVSAGQAQLLALTRVFLANPGLVILDEASARLDPATEALLERAIAGLLRGRTGIIIAHRLATLGRVDEIMVLEKGRLVEHGPYERLAVDPRSRFFHMLQTGRTEVSL